MHASTSPTAAAGVEVVDLHRTFDGGVKAIDGISLKIEPGEFAAILGPSGCGKSTLLRIIAGLDRPTSGSVDVGNSSVAYVFQDAHLLPWRNVLRNVALPLELLGAGRRERDDAARDVLSQVGLSDAIERFPSQLSGGMRMRVSLARALITNPRLLLLDEPFAALDEITRQHLDDHLFGLWRARKMTVIFVTHSTAEATFLAQRAIVFSQRPAKVVADIRVELPEDRTAELRGEADFAGQTRRIYKALAEGGA